jgi:hypothetical protein
MAQRESRTTEIYSLDQRTICSRKRERHWWPPYHVRTNSMTRIREFFYSYLKALFTPHFDKYPK